MRKVLLVLSAVLAFGCSRPDPVHRGDGGVAATVDGPEPGSTGGTGGPSDTGGTGGSPDGSGGSGATGGTGGADTGGTGGADTGGSGGMSGTGGDSGGGNGGGGTGGAGTGGDDGTGGDATGGSGGSIELDAGSTGGAGGGVGCAGAQDWRVGTYKGGDEVKAGTPPHRYRCKDFPYDGWCGISAYQPGGSGPWMDAWLDLGACP
jgi:hypothetical protein